MGYMYTNLSSWRAADCAVDRILPGEVPAIWPTLQKYLDRTPEMWETGYDQEMFLHEILQGTLQLWVFTEKDEVLVFATTQVRSIGAKKLIVFTWLAGKRMTERALIQFGLDCAHRYAAHVHAQEIRIEGRAGWQKLLSRLGFTQKHVVLSIPINKERMN